MSQRRTLVRGLAVATTLATALSAAAVANAQLPGTVPAPNGPPQVAPRQPPAPTPTASTTATPFAPPPSVLSPTPPAAGTSSTPGGTGSSSRPGSGSPSGPNIPSAAQGATSMPQVAPMPPPPGARVLTLEDCVQIALAGNVDAKTSELDVDVADAGNTGARGRILPKLQVDGALQEWDRAFVLPFGGTDLQVRDQFTWTIGATIIQPLTGLFGGVSDFKAASLGVDIAKLQHETTKRDVGFRAAELYLRLLEAKRIVEVAVASVQALEGQAKLAASQHANGVIAKNDLLRAQLAYSNAKQREIAARGQVTMARGRLATLLGLPRGLPVDAAPLGEAAQASDSATINVEAAETQSTHRLEVKAFDTRIEQADERVSSARDKLLPQINGVANYTHYQGSEFQQKDAAYIGVSGSWNVWDWGATYSESKSAAQQREQAKLARVRIEDQVRLEARQAAVDAQSAHEALDVAKTAVVQAEENYRIVSRRFEEAAGTAFDVVDAEALLTQSRAQFEQASYDWLVARLALERATGEAAPHVK